MDTRRKPPDGRVRPILACLILTAVLVTTGAGEGETVVGGVGTETCVSWIVARRDHLALGYEQWLLGYLSGVGDVHSARLDPLNGIDVAAVCAWVDAYCAAYPLDHIEWAVEAFVDAHRADRPTCHNIRTAGQKFEKPHCVKSVEAVASGGLDRPTR